MLRFAACRQSCSKQPLLPVLRSSAFNQIFTTKAGRERELQIDSK